MVRRAERGLMSYDRWKSISLTLTQQEEVKGITGASVLLQCSCA